MATKNLNKKTSQLMAPTTLVLALVGVLCLDLGCSVHSSPPPPTRSGAVGGADANQAPHGDIAIMVAGQKWTGNTDIDSTTLRVVGD